MSLKYDYAAVQKAWEQLQSGQLVDTDIIRDEIATSWMRSVLEDLHPEWVAATRRSLSSMVAARPMLFNYLYSQLNTMDSNGYFRTSLAVLTDNEGHLLKSAGSAGLQKEMERSGVTEGFCFAESIVGTNAIGLCLHSDEPAYVYGNEHYHNAFKGFYCAAASIYDHKGILVAVLALFTHKIQHPFDVAMVASTAEYLGREIKIHHKHAMLQDAETRLDVLMNTLNYGVLFLDEDRKILQANSIARYLLLLYEYELLGLSMEEFIRPDDINFAAIEGNLVDQPVTVTTVGDKKFSYNASVYLVTPRGGSATRYIVTLSTLKSPVHSNAKGTASSLAHYTFDDIVGTAPRFAEAVRLAKIAAKNRSTVLITGESGTGKELFAQSIHNASAFSKGPFVAINCGAIPKELIESELFGYEDGAFTGAKKGGVAGKFELANGGTVFLDEIGDMPYTLQVSLLRFLQNREITRIGGKQPIKVDVRIITATNKNLEQAILNGVFRSDLFYRINIFNINVPSLRERPSDISNLAHYFLQKHKSASGHIFTGYAPEALAALEAYRWPGNVREIENVVERAVLTCHSSRVELENLPNSIRESYLGEPVREARWPSPLPPAQVPISAETPPAREVSEQSPSFHITDIEKNAILKALEFTGGNVKRSAEIIGISRRTLYRKMEKYNIFKHESRK